VFPNKGKEFPEVDYRRARKAEYALAIGTALRGELRQMPNAIKTVMRWTGANERTVKNWIAGTHGPSGEHLIVLAHHSSEVMAIFHRLAGRHGGDDKSLGVIRKKLVETLNIIDDQCL